TDYVNGVNDMFYELVDNEMSLRQHNQVVTEKNIMLSNLCRTLQNENKQLGANLKIMQGKEQEWRENIQKKFDESLENIRKQMGEHQAKYVKLIQENEVYRLKIDELVEFERKRTTDYSNYKSHASQLGLCVLCCYYIILCKKNKNKKIQKLQETEKINMRTAVDSCKQEIKNLTKKLARSLEENSQLEKKCKEHESKFTETARKMQSNADTINQFKEMKTKVLQENTDLHQELKNLMAKYTQANTYNDVLQQSLRAGSRKADLLQKLCRGLQQQNTSIKERMKANGIDYQTVLQNIVYTNKVNNSSATAAVPTFAPAPVSSSLDHHGTEIDTRPDPPFITDANASVSAASASDTSASTNATDKASGDTATTAAAPQVEEKQEEKTPSQTNVETSTQSTINENQPVPETEQKTDQSQQSEQAPTVAE
ncbi:alpha-taxilin, partial [Reticulomyxa filosa]